MLKEGTGNDKQGKDAGNRTLCSCRNFSQAISEGMRYGNSLKFILIFADFLNHIESSVDRNQS